MRLVAERVGRPVSDPATRIPVTVVAALAGVGFVVACAVWGGLLSARGAQLHLGGGVILTGAWDPRFPAAALGAIGLALVLGRYAVTWAQRASWPVLVAGAGVLTAGWAVALAVTDGISALGAPLGTRWEYLADTDRVGALRPFLTTFTDHVLGGSPGFQWATHVAGHPPGALLVFVGLDRLGLGGPAWGAALCVGAGASAVPAVLLSLRLLAGEPAARAAAPFVALAPSVLWIATSADALFLGVSAWGVCGLAHAASRRDLRGDLLAVGAGVLLGVSLFLSYGLTLVGLLAFTVVVVQRRIRPLLFAAPAVAAVVGVFAAGGFWWVHGLAVATARVKEGPAWIERPTTYFLVANLAALAVAVGPAAVGALAQTGAGARKGLDGVLGRGVMLPAAGLTAVLLAVASSLSKGEVERIYLPFELWLLTATAALPERQRRWWLAGQLALALALQLFLRLKW